MTVQQHHFKKALLVVLALAGLHMVFKGKVFLISAIAVLLVSAVAVFFHSRKDSN